jgi:hypothetical protein
MSPRLASSGEDGQSGGKLALSVVLVLGLAVLLLVIVRAKPNTEAFDPRSSRDDGARALVLLLEAQGADVAIERSLPEPGADERVLVLDDRLNPQQRDELIDWIEAGGIAIVADPSSSLHGGAGVDGGAVEVVGDDPVGVGPSDALSEANVTRDECTVAALTDLRGLWVPSGLLFPVGPSEPQCFSDGEHAFVIVRSLGKGLVVGLGDNDPLTNQHLRYADNSGLATALLTPSGDARVRIVLGRDAPKNAADIGSGDQRLIDLVRPGVWMALLQLALAFVIFAFARGIRTGRPVDERPPAPLAGSEFVVASGTLMQRAGHVERAAWILRGRFYRDVCRELRLPPSTAIADLDAHLVERHAFAAGELTQFFQQPVATEQQLVELTATMHTLRQRVATPTESPSTPQPDHVGSQL